MTNSQRSMNVLVWIYICILSPVSQSKCGNSEDLPWVQNLDRSFFHPHHELTQAPHSSTIIYKVKWPNGKVPDGMMEQTFSQFMPLLYKRLGSRFQMWLGVFLVGVPSGQPLIPFLLCGMIIIWMPSWETFFPWSYLHELVLSILSGSRYIMIQTLLSFDLTQEQI